MKRAYSCGTEIDTYLQRNFARRHRNGAEYQTPLEAEKVYGAKEQLMPYAPTCRCVTNADCRLQTAD